MPHIYIMLVLIAIYVGVYFRHNQTHHVRIMLSCFVLDMVAVLYLELNRGVIFKALDRVPESIMKVHLTFAVLTLVGYGVAMITGRMLLKNQESVRIYHRINAATFLIARTGVFITSLWIKS